MNRSYLLGFFLIEISQMAMSKLNNEDPGVITIASEEETKEPSCDELRKIWRHTKREFQQKTEVTTPRYKARYHHEPFAYGWKSPARPRNAMYSKPVYGRIVHSPDKYIYRANVPSRLRSYDQVARMVGSSNYYPSPNAQKPATYFRLDYPNSVRRPVVPPMRVSHMGRFQELQNILRNDRANEMLLKLKESESGMDTASSSDFPNDERANSKYNTYSFSQSSEDDVTSGNLNERKSRETDGSETDTDSVYSDKLPSETRDENENSQSTSKPDTMDDSILRRWALGEWK